MIKTGIVGADSKMAGELLRILVNHPDIDLIALCAPDNAGIRADVFHHGLAGQTSLAFSKFLDPKEMDLLIIDDHSELATRLRNVEEVPETMRIIDMSHGPVPTVESASVYGLSELNRKQLVREARRAVVPRSAAALAIIALLPLASNLLLPTSITGLLQIPADLAVPEKIDAAEREATYWLGRVQSSFNGNFSLSVEQEVPQYSRGMRLKVQLPSSLSHEIARDMYDARFEDHNFVFITEGDMDFRQVEGTDKVLLKLHTDEPGFLTVEAIADCRLRGGAGDAVHILNLLFGLYETTGLQLKAARFD